MRRIGVAPCDPIGAARCGASASHRATLKGVARCGPTIRAARSAPLLLIPALQRPTFFWSDRAQLGHRAFPHDDGRRLRRGHMTPSAGVVRARVASRLALSRRPACSCPSDAAATLICRTSGTPRLGGECWQPGCAMLVLLPALCDRVGWPSFHALARPAERSFRWQHSLPSAGAVCE